MVTDEETSLESGYTKEPDLDKIAQEVYQANSDASRYMTRMGQIGGWWFCEWPNQTVDGRRWAPEGMETSIFPWNGCSDSRLRLVENYVDEHVMLAQLAFWNAKVQTKSIRPIVSGKEANVLQNMLNWTVYTKMKRQLLNELPVAFGWRYGHGLSFLSIEWEQQRELSYVPITLDMLAQLSTAFGMDDITVKILDTNRDFDDALIKSMQRMSPVLPRQEARKVLTELRNTGASQLPTATLRINQPRWTALRPFTDVWFPSETTDLQQARWTARRELVSEADIHRK